MQFKAGQKLSAAIEKLSLSGDGIARVSISDKPNASNFVVFVPYASPGDKVEIRISERKKNFARGQITRILKNGATRTEPPCPYYFSPHLQLWCGGCNFQHLKYASQLKEKVQMLRETLEKFANISPHRVLEMIGSISGNEWRYRNKIQIPFRKSADGDEIAAGFFAPHSHQLVPIEDCLIHPQEMMGLVKFVRETMQNWHLAGYAERNHSGWLRHLLIRREESTGKMLAVFVTLADFFPNQNKWIELIKKNFPDVTGVCQNVNSRRTNVILGTKWRKIFGQDFLIEKLGNLGPARAPLKLKVSAGSFFQVNTKMTEKLYRTVQDFVLEEGQPRRLLLDLYCGVGGIGLACAPHFEKVIGIDETLSSIRDAKENRILNQIPNCDFFCADALSFLRDSQLPTLNSQLSTVVIDPPRSGCSEEVLNRISKILPGKIVYISCEPSTLARDLKILSLRGYRVKKVQPVDMFPQSSHIESVALLEK